MSDAFVILVGIKVAIFLAVLGIATLELLMNKKKGSIFGLILMAVAFLTTGFSELLFLLSKETGELIINLNLAIVNSIFLILGGLGLILYFSGLKPHKK